MSGSSRRATVAVVACVVLALVLALLRVLVGRTLVDDAIVLDWSVPAGIVRELRLSAALSAGLAGAALGLSGLLLQVLLRNPLASPFILGVSSGAGLGVMLGLAAASVFGVTWFADGRGGTVVPATIGALLALAATWRFGRRAGAVDPLALVLAGVVVSAIAGALTMSVQAIVPHGLKADFVVWTMGRIPERPATGLVWTLGITVTLALALATAWGTRLDLACFGDDEARASGLDLGRVRGVLFVLAGLLAASSVALVGPVGFVGLVAPHLARLVVGPDHRRLVLAAAALGAAVLLGAEVLRTVIDLGAGRLPVGVFTALAGGPAFLWLLRRDRGWTT